MKKLISVLAIVALSATLFAVNTQAQIIDNRENVQSNEISISDFVKTYMKVGNISLSASSNQNSNNISRGSDPYKYIDGETTKVCSHRTKKCEKSQTFTATEGATVVYRAVSLPGNQAMNSNITISCEIGGQTSSTHKKSQTLTEVYVSNSTAGHTKTITALVEKCGNLNAGIFMNGVTTLKIVKPKSKKTASKLSPKKKSQVISTKSPAKKSVLTVV
jgi:hypothetical protein